MSSQNIINLLNTLLGMEQIMRGVESNSSMGSVNMSRIDNTIHGGEQKNDDVELIENQINEEDNEESLTLFTLENDQYINYTTLKDEFECSICQNIMKGEVTLVNQCFHKFCGKCIIDHCLTKIRVGNVANCPLCRTEINSPHELIISTNFTERLNNENVKCCHSMCDKTMTRKEYYTHFYECEFKKTRCTGCKSLKLKNHVCETPIVECELCKSMYSKNYTHTCPFVEIKCDNLGCDVTCKRYEFNQHLANCEYNPTICKLGCTNIISKKNMETHIKTCENRLIQCPDCNKPMPFKKYKKEGCRYTKDYCSWCSTYVFRYEFATHKERCKYRPIECQFCKERFGYKDMDIHTVMCEKQPLKCYKCDVEYMGSHLCINDVIKCVYCNEEFRRKDKFNHDLICEELLVECKYSYCGCRYKCKRKNIDTHLKREMGVHLEMLEQYTNEKR